MKYMNKKGQGFDTFKLLIAAVVAMVILGIVTGVFGKIWGIIGGISCVSSPINEMVTTIQDAQTGLRATTQDICLASGEGFDAEDIASQLSSVGPGDITFSCKAGHAVCEGDGAPLELSGNSVDAAADATFKATVDCTSTGGAYKCSIEIKNA
jgi:hypothetical protein